MPASPSNDSILPRYSISAPTSPPAHAKRESVYAIIASYALPSKTRPPKSRRAPPPPALQLVPSQSPSRTKAVQYPPSPWHAGQGKSPVKWEWSAPVGGEESAHIVGEEGKADVFSAVEEAEREAKADKRITIMHRGWEPTLDGPKVTLRGVIGVSQILMVTASLLLTVLVFCSPLKTLASSGLLTITLNDRILALGALGGCLRGLDGARQHCSSLSLTPFFADLFSSASLSTSIASQLPYSFPLFPSALVLAMLGLTVILAALAFLHFPRRKVAGAPQHHGTVLLVAVGGSIATLAVGLSASLAQWSSLTKMVERAEGVEVEIGSAFRLLWVAWVLLGLTVVGWGVQKREKEEQVEKDEKSVV